MWSTSSISLLVVLLCLLSSLLLVHSRVYNIEDYGARTDQDCTVAIRSTLKAAALENNGAEVLIPKGNFISAPINITSNIIFRVNGHLKAMKDSSRYPPVSLLPSYNYDLDLGHFSTNSSGHLRHHPFIWSVNATNITICGSGIIDGSGSYWLERYHNKTLNKFGRPHLMEINGGKDITIGEKNTDGSNSRLTLLNSGFWTLHPIYCNNVHIHNINIIASHCNTWNNKCNPNIDGIDIDSSTNVLIENNHISVGDDHVTILSGGGDAGRKYNMPSKNITVKNNILGTGMGLSIGSSVSGGIEDVLYYNNTMNETRMQWGQGAHIKTRVGIGGYIRNIVWDSNTYYNTGSGAILIEAGYQSNGTCDATNCTRIEDIVLRNLTFFNATSPGSITCRKEQPCSNITFDNVKIINYNHTWRACENVIDSTFTNVLPKGLKEMCGSKSSKSTKPNDNNNDRSHQKGYAMVFISIFFGGVAVGVLIFCYLRYDVRSGLKKVRHYISSKLQMSDMDGSREPLLDTIIFETDDTNTIVV